VVLTDHMRSPHWNVCRMSRYIWAYWISPFAYLLRAVVINEMTSPAWRTPVATQGGGTTTAGEASLLDVQRKPHAAIFAQLYVCMLLQGVPRLTPHLVLVFRWRYSHLTSSRSAFGYGCASAMSYSWWVCRCHELQLGQMYVKAVPRQFRTPSNASNAFNAVNL
jgi:hypothetical protein